MKIFKNSFGNSINLKFQITQITQSDEQFYNLLNNIKGDLFQNKGVNFDKLIIHSLNYLFINCINTSDLKDEDFNLEFAKSILDKNNCTGYTPIKTSPNSTNIPIYKKQYYKEAFAFIQLAYYLNEINLEENQFFKYINHFLNTNTKLPDNQYNLDLDYLHKKYDDYNKSKKNNFAISSRTTLKNHFYGCLYIICNDLGLSTSNFKSNFSVGRDYNPMVKVNREFRKYFPFLLNEYDIKSAYPRFIDLQIGCDVADGIYDNLVDANNITRDEAKRLYNKNLNSGHIHSRDYFKPFFEPIYKEYTDTLIDLIVDLKTPIWKVLQRWEFIAIENFKETNNLKNVTRLHDAIICIDNKFTNEIKTKFNFYEFGFKQLNEIEEEFNFQVSKKNSRYSYVSSIPTTLRSSGYTFQKDTKKGNVFKDKFFNIYTDDFFIWKSSFNIAYRGTIADDVFVTITSDEFINKCKYSIDVIRYLNNDKNKDSIYFIINEIIEHIYSNGAYSFNKDYLRKLLFEYAETPAETPIAKIRNWHFVGNSELNNINFYKFNQLRHEATRNAKKFFYASSIIHIVKHSYNNEIKKFIRYNDLELTDKRQSPIIYDLVYRFNAANGFTDVRSANCFNELCTMYVSLYSNTLYKVTDFVHNYSLSAISKEFSINRRTATKFKNWIEQPQDKEELKAILKELNLIIEEQIEVKEEEKQSLPTCTWNDAFNIEEEEYTITKTEENYFQVNITTTQVATPKHYSKSVLNCDPEAAIRNDICFITSWLLFHNPTLKETERSLIKNNPQKTADFVKDLYYNNLPITWNENNFFKYHREAS